MMPYNPIDGNYLTRRFKQIFDDSQRFAEEYDASQFAKTQPMERETLELIYALLYARYGNSCIASYDENQFKYSVWGKIFMYGPTWIKRIEIQKALRELSIKDLQTGDKAIYNTALNPSSKPTTQTLEELDYINQQNTSNYKKSKLNAYSNLISLLETDVTAEFVDKFKNLFIKIVQPDYPLWYVTTPEEQAILDGED